MLGTRRDLRGRWCIAAVWVRVRTAEYVTSAGRALALGGPAVFLLVLAIWLPGGPFAPGWARRAGTPVKLIAGARTTFGHQRDRPMSLAAEPVPAAARGDADERPAGSACA